MTEALIDLPSDGRCPCGSQNLTLAEDQTEYTLISKNEAGKWERGTNNTEPMGEGDPLGTVRLFCPECSMYFIVPGELI